MALTSSTESSLAALDRLKETGGRALAKRRAELQLLKDEQDEPQQ